MGKDVLSRSRRMERVGISQRVLNPLKVGEQWLCRKYGALSSHVLPTSVYSLLTLYSDTCVGGSAPGSACAKYWNPVPALLACGLSLTAHVRLESVIVSRRRYRQITRECIIFASDHGLPTRGGVDADKNADEEERGEAGGQWVSTSSCAFLGSLLQLWL